MYYQIHILIQEEDGIFRHIPLYFCTTQDKEKAVENFKKVCAQVFEFMENVAYKDFEKPLLDGTIKQAMGDVTSSYNHKGCYLVELQQNVFKPTCASFI